MQIWQRDLPHFLIPLSILFCLLTFDLIRLSFRLPRGLIYIICIILLLVHEVVVYLIQNYRSIFSPKIIPISRSFDECENTIFKMQYVQCNTCNAIRALQYVQCNTHTAIRALQYVQCNTRTATRVIQYAQCNTCNATRALQYVQCNTRNATRVMQYAHCNTCAMQCNTRNATRAMQYA